MYFTFRFKEEHLELFDRVIETLLQEKWDTFVRFRFFRRMIWFFVYAAIFLTAFLLRPGTDNYESLWVTLTVNVLEILKKSDHLAKDYNIQPTTRRLSADCIQRSKRRHKHSEQGSKRIERIQYIWNVKCSPQRYYPYLLDDLFWLLHYRRNATSANVTNATEEFHNCYLNGPPRGMYKWWRYAV